MTLGAGCQLVLHATATQASAEAYMGLVEAGVGLLPAAGGCKEMLLRTGAAKQAFDLISKGRTSASAIEAREFQFLRPQDRISMNPERLIGDAKTLALALVPTHAPGAPRDDIRVEGEAAYASMRLSVYAAREAGQISDYDATIGEALASVLSGGRLTGAQSVSEQYLLDLERSAFLSLCGNRQTQERIEHMLRTGKPLRN
jgi:3-hydroxyacyl-CoA dehydrogenase